MLIKKIKSRMSVIFVLLPLVLLFSGGFIFQTQAYASENNTYLASQDFSSTQGNGNWYYEQFNGSTYSNMAWNSNNSCWEGTYQYCLIYNNKQHPSTNASARKWVAPKTGTVKIVGTAVKEAVGGNGVIVSIKQNDTTIWGSYTVSAGDTTAGQHHNFTINVSEGDSIRFIVEDNGNDNTDATIWNPAITYLDSNSYTASQSFGFSQGKGNWYYEQLSSKGYSNMTWNTTDNRWEGDNSECFVDANQLHPSTNASVRKWIAPQTGTVQIKGTVVKETAGGNGVIVSIKQNDTTIWGSNLISANDTTKGQYHNLIINLKEGDTVRFIVSNNGDSSNDCTLWDPTITYLEAYRASLGFNSIQGQNQWYYQQADAIYSSSYTDMVYSSNQWTGSYDSCLIGSNWQHPDTNVSVRKWIAPKAGRYKIFGTAKKQTAGGNGVILSIQQTKNYELWGTTLLASDTIGVSHDVIVDLNENDTISFVVSDNGNDSYDTTIWDPTIVLLETAYASQNYSTTTQGQGNWYYQEWNGTSYINMTWDNNYKWWRGSSEFTAVSTNWQHPEVNDSVRKWVATASGKITISGNIKLDSSKGDGVIVSIKKNDTVLWGPVVVSGKDLKSHHITTDIAAGEAIYFIVNKNNNSSYDTTKWDPYISYGHDSLTSEGWSFGDTSTTVFTTGNGVYEDGNIGMCRDDDGYLWAITGHTNHGL